MAEPELTEATPIGPGRKLVHFSFEKFPSLYGIEEAAEKVGLPAERLRDLAEGMLCPHYRIDEGQPLFNLPELKRWVGANLVRRCAGADLPYVVRVTPQLTRDWVTQPPDCLLPMSDKLREAETGCIVSGVYFLCHGNAVVYIGQGRNVLRRIAAHGSNDGVYPGAAGFGKVFDRAYWVPVAPDHLSEVEGALIKHLCPAQNGKSKNGIPLGPIAASPEKTLAGFGFGKAATVELAAPETESVQ